MQALFTLGLCYEEGKPDGIVTADIWAALKLFQQAADQGHPEAQTRLGYSYLQGKGLPENDQLGSSCFSSRRSSFIRRGRTTWGTATTMGLASRRIGRKPPGCLSWRRKQATWLQHTEPERVQVQRA